MNTPLHNASASTSWQRGGQCHLKAPDGTAIARYADGSHSCNKKLIWDLRFWSQRYVIVLVNVPPSGSIFLHARQCGVRLVYIPAKLISYVQPTRVFALSKHAESLAGGKSKIGKGSDLHGALHKLQQKRS